MFMGDLTFLRALMLILREVGTTYYINKIKTLKTITEKRFTVKVSVFILKKRRKFSASDSFISARIGQDIDSMLLLQVALGANLSPPTLIFFYSFYFLSDIIQFELAKIMQQSIDLFMVKIASWVIIIVVVYYFKN